MAASDASAPSIADRPLPRGRAPLLSGLAGRAEHLFEAERAQLPLWLPVGLGLGIAAWFALPDANAWTAFLLGAGALFCAALAAGWSTRWGRALAIFALAAACGCGLVWSKAERVAAPVLTRPGMAEFTAEVESLQRLPAREAVRLVVVPAAGSGLPKKLRINLDEEDAVAAFAPGATLRIKA